MRYRVTLANGKTRTFEYKPEVGMAGELVCQVDMETVDGLSTAVAIEDVIYAPHVWYSVDAVAEVSEER